MGSIDDIRLGSKYVSEERLWKKHNSSKKVLVEYPNVFQTFDNFIFCLVAYDSILGRY